MPVKSRASSTKTSGFARSVCSTENRTAYIVTISIRMKTPNRRGTPMAGRSTSPIQLDASRSSGPRDESSPCRRFGFVSIVSILASSSVTLTVSASASTIVRFSASQVRPLGRKTAASSGSPSASRASKRCSPPRNLCSSPRACSAARSSHPRTNGSRSLRSPAATASQSFFLWHLWHLSASFTLRVSDQRSTPMPSSVSIGKVRSQRSSDHSRSKPADE